MLNRVQQPLGASEELLSRSSFEDHSDFERPVPAEDVPSAEANASADVLPEPPRLIRFDAGQAAGLPIVCFPANVAGLPYYLRRLAACLSPMQPCWVVKPHEAVEGTHLRTIEEIARLAIQAVRAAIPKGPYCIAGHCYGGVLAYEVTRQLRADGEDVPVLLLLDASAPGYPKVIRNWKRYWNALRNPPGVAEIQQHLATLARLITRPHRAKAGRLLASAGVEQLIPSDDPGLANSLVMSEYEPRPLNVPVVHFIAADQPVTTRVLDDPRYGWREWARAGFTTKRVAGGHFSMFDAQHAPGLASAIRRTLARLTV